MKKLLLLIFGLAIACIAAYAVPQDILKKDTPIDHVIKIFSPVQEAQIVGTVLITRAIGYDQGISIYERDLAMHKRRYRLENLMWRNQNIFYTIKTKEGSPTSSLFKASRTGVGIFSKRDC